jgi:Glycosyl hydrolases family 15
LLAARRHLHTLRLLETGFSEEAKAWRDWLLRAVAESPKQMQIMYGAAGEHRLTEFELPDLPGYEGSRLLRIGNAGSEQLQLDVYGELLDSAYLSRQRGLHGIEPAGISRERSSVISKQSGLNQMTESGKYAAYAVTSSIPKLWRGSPSTAPFASFKNSKKMAHSSVGSAYAATFTMKSAVSASAAT